MFVSSMNTYYHSHNNDPTKQKTCQTIVSSLIYISIYLYMSQVFTFIKIIFLIFVYIHIYMYKSVVKMSPQIQRIEKISHITHSKTY